MAANQKKTRDLDATTLFENHSIEEVRAVERKIRNEIEWKKEEMRDLVGERYRDLISAADTIREMKDCAERVGVTLNQMSSHCQTLKSTHNVKGAMLNSAVSGLKTGGKNTLYEVACKIRLLLAVPSRLWRYMDAGDLLSSAQLFLLSRHVHSTLQYGTTGSTLSERFPMIVRQWAAISHFREAILKQCRSSLASLQLSGVKVAEALTAIVLLEDKTPRQVFQDFLVARMYNGPTTVSSVKIQVAEAVQQLHNTMFQISNIFCGDSHIPGTDGNLLSATINRVLNSDVLDDLGADEISALKTHLPKSIINFRPAVRVQNSSLPVDYLQSSCDKWLNSCLTNVKKSVEDLLGYVMSIKSLAGIRDHLWQTLSEDERLTHWTKICTQLLSKPVSVWSEEVSGLFTKRAEAIVQSGFTKLFDDMDVQLSSAKQTMNSDDLKRIEIDMRTFIWSESTKDIPTNCTWVSSANKTFEDGGPLLMKAFGYTPLVQSLCQCLNEHLCNLLSDLETYRQPKKICAELELLIGDQDEVSIRLAKFTSESCYQCVTRFKSHLDELITSCESTVTQENTTSVASNNRLLLLLARFSAAVPKLCPELKKAVSLSTSGQGSTGSATPSLLNSRKSMSRSYSKQVDPLWSESVEMFSSCSQSAYKLWSERLIENLHQEFQAHMIRPSSELCIENVTRWDDIEIQEDTEDGQTRQSMISVPMQATTCLQKLLYGLCNEVDSVGCHSLDRIVLGELIASALVKILNIYSDIIACENERKLTQTTSLQYLFDVWYVTGILQWKNTSQAVHLEKLIAMVTDHFQSKVDPFDLDVFTPHMQKHVNRQRARHMVMFGAITETEKVSSATQRQLLSGRQEQHNILPLFSSSHARFPQLPLTAEPSSLLTLSRQESAANQPFHDDTKVLTQVQSEPTMKTSSSTSSFYDKLGAMSWFKT